MQETKPEGTGMQITMDVPEDYLLDRSPDEVASRLKLYAAVLMFQAGEISAGGAAQLAGVDRFAFAAECARHGIPVVDYAPGDLHGEMESLRRG
jgi:predicted HTH domain antitoxin